MHRKTLIGMLLFLLTLGLVITLQPRLSATPARDLNATPPLIAQTHSSRAPVESPRSPSEPLSFPDPTRRGVPNLFPSGTSEPITAITRSDQPRFREGENGSTDQPTYLTIDILWILLCSGLVFLMQAGFMCLESGLTRSKNSINVAVKNFTDFGCSVTLFWAFGFALMFGTSFQGWIGGSGFFLKTDLPAFDLAFFLFQAMFCGTATTIVSGAVAERMKFGSYLLIACLISGVIYPIFGHWTWNGVNHGELMGWLGKLGFVDFAGSTVVHSVGGWVSLASLPIVGARAGRFPKFGKAEKIHGSNLPISVLGALILWLGWFGFNGGSTLALNEDVARVIVNTVLAGVAGMMTALITGWWSREIPEVDRLINGSLAGLVAITACCHGVTAISAVTIGAIAGLVAIAVEYLLARFQLDDAVGAVPVHLGGGIWGTLAVALFGKPELLGTGLSRLEQLGVQVLGIVSCFILAFGIAYSFLWVVNRFSPLRVSASDEYIGLNVSEHRAKTEILDLFRVMDAQAKTQDLTLRVPVEPFTEVGQIADRYNQVMNALEEAVTRTDAIVRTATDAIATFNASDFQIMSLNPRAEVIFDYPKSVLLGMSLPQIIEFGLDVLYWQPDKTLKIQQVLSEIVASGRPHELVGIRADGSRFPVEVSITEAKFRDTAFYTGTFRDITHRKQAQQALEDSEERFRRLSGATLEAIIVHEQGKIIDVNQTAVKMFGYPIADLIDHNGLSLIVAEDRDLVLKHIVNGYEKPYEVTGLKQDGTRFPIEIEGRSLPSEGRELRVAAIRDITERKQAQAALRDSEERFRAVMEQAADGFIIHDLEGQIIEVNHAVCDSLGYSRQELLDRSMADLEQHLPFATLKQRWREMSRGVPLALEGVHRRQDGSTFPVDVRVGLLEAGNRKLLLALCRDITERKQAESALRNEQEKSERLLLNILPEAIATRLKQEQGTIADGFAEATVLFADIVGFTKLASRVSPTELVHLLNDIFSTFDLLAERHGLEKIKTIGDAYMVVGGLPLPREDHAEAIARMALDMQQAVIEFSTKIREPFTIRIGINSGPVIAGVIGLKKFIYDLWGDTVNIASRMESHGIPGAIQVTEATYSRLEGKFILEKRGPIQVKGKGQMTTYLLKHELRIRGLTSSL